MTRLIETDKSFLDIYTFDNDQLVRDCIDEIKDLLISKPKVFVYGKEVNQNRSIGFFSDESIGYHYSGQMASSISCTPSLTVLLNNINTMFNTNYNGILINRYDTGTDYIGAHSDNELYLDKNGVVALSHGAIRKFRIRDKQTKKIIKDIPTTSNQIIHMGGEFQKEFTHEIPIEKKVKDIRYSFTFRKHLI